MASSQHRHAVAIFSNYQDAEAALTELKISGFPVQQICVISGNGNQLHQIAGVEVISKPTGYKANNGTSQGATSGDASERTNRLAGGVKGLLIGGVGGLLVMSGAGLLMGIGALVIPGIGPVMLAGSITTAIATTLAGGAIGITVGAPTGGLIGSLIGLRIPQEQAINYSERVSSSGDFMIVVNGTESEVSSAETILNNRS